MAEVEASPGTYRRMLDECACLNVRKAARVLTQCYDRGLAASGIRSTQLPLLVTTALHERINVGELASEVLMDRTTVSRTLSLLERKGWVRVLPGADQRTREVELTTEGEGVLESAVTLWQRTQKEVERDLGEDCTNRVLPDLVRQLSRLE